jgi:hypothetical protein
MRTPQDPNHKPTPRRGPIGAPVKRYHPPTSQTVFLENSISVWGWPSRGGLIVLEHATTLDFEFLGLDLIHPSMRRNPNQEDEDKLCQRLLMLGAKWFDSRERYGFVGNVAEDNELEIEALDNGEAEKPTTMERRWVSVGYPSGPAGGLWVLEYDTVMYGMQEKLNLVPIGAVRVQLAKTMDMKCEILKSMGAEFYASLRNYDGAACLNAWEEKTEGEFGQLVVTRWEEG